MDGQVESSEDVLRREVTFRRIADARSAGRISDKNAVAERLPAHFAHDSGHRQTAGQPGEAEWACKFGRIGRRGRSRRSQTPAMRSEEHTSELQSLMRISYAVFCLKKKTRQHQS